jgi:ribose 5-phosphate isomerase A
MMEAKKGAGYKAAEHIKDGMSVGLGTGSTAYYFIEKLGEKCRNGLQIRAVPSSNASRKFAESLNIPLVDIDTLSHLDITVDGADEIDPKHRMIKGGGGALLREKLLAKMSREVIIVVDESKLVEKLGKVHLPVEIVPFAHKSTTKRLQAEGFKGNLRNLNENSLFMTDQGNYIYDIHFDHFIENPEEIHSKIKSITGVVDSGFFFNLAKRILVGYPSGHAEFLSCKQKE